MVSGMVVGSTGLVGKHLVKEMSASGRFNSIIALVRKKQFDHVAGVEEKITIFSDNESLEKLKTVDHVFCCLGTTIKKAGSKKTFKVVDLEIPFQLAKWAEKRKVKSFSIITSMGANPNSKIFYNRIKGRVEKEISKLSIPKIHIFRPSLILGKRDEFRLGELCGKSIFKILSPLLIGSLARFKAIHARDIARGMLLHLSDPREGVKIIESNSILLKNGANPKHD
ncbi:MAG: nucleoside-diphosphate sugar epimerase [Candidatus Marinimicrobia bacterium]|nr:nucleoside-diphosphate sugar epimerase [Candidatus Neomarinimicrobiota bacterium]